MPVVESGKDGKFVGKSDLTLHKVDGKWKVEKVTTQAISVKGVADDPAIVAKVKPWHDKTLTFLQQVIGEATDAFPGAESNHQDSAIVDFVNDVQRHYAGTQLSAGAAFNTSQNIDKGPITLQEISGLYIYENYLFGIEINGAELRKYMEHAASFYGTSPDYNYDMVQGVDYTIDLNQPVGHRITKLQYQGKDVKDTDTFTMAINDYRMNGWQRLHGSYGLHERQEAESHLRLDEALWRRWLGPQPHHALHQGEGHHHPDRRPQLDGHP